MGLGRTLAILALFALAACATISPRSRIESELVELGLGERASACLAEELADDLSRRDLDAVADFLAELNRSGRRSDGFDAILRIDNSRAAAAIAGAGVTCALSR
jgi:hypothetical protein